MELHGERTIPASQVRTWAALNDPEILKGCIAGCESLEQTGDDTLQAVVAVRVGPVNARFKGKLQLADVHAPVSYSMSFDGQGGAAGFGKGVADVQLVEAGPNQTTLKYLARAQVGGKLAQVGSRLIDAAASKIAEDFFIAFESKLREEAGLAPAEAPEPEHRLLWLAASLLVLAVAAYAIFK
jgi:uncharacterized protein